MHYLGTQTAESDKNLNQRGEPKHFSGGSAKITGQQKAARPLSRDS